MPISKTNDSQSDAFERAIALYTSGQSEEAIRQLDELGRNVSYFADKAVILYHEVLWLIDSKRDLEARGRFSELNREILSVDARTLDPEAGEQLQDLQVMVRFAEAKLLVAEGSKSEASRVLERLVSQSANRLSLPAFGEIANEVQILRGVLLVDAGRSREALSLLESAFAPPGWEGFLNFYRGRCYFDTSDFVKAKQSSQEALKFQMIPKWEAWTHYQLGRSYYQLREFFAAKEEFERSLKIADSGFVQKHKLLDWLESTSSALKSLAGVENGLPQPQARRSKPN